jgi:hypothetical protein|tara:strand:+ start:15607 stop:16269 length:663 start_codon:yes stop_codon:yes gene_type:complete
MLINFKIFVIALVFLLGLYYYVNSIKTKELFSTKSSNDKCPTMLIEKDGKIFLFNSKAEIQPNINPIQFENLEEYAEFVELQKSKNINCPILFLQYTTDTQNNDLLQIKPSIFETQGGLPINKSETLKTTLQPDYFEKNEMQNAVLDSNPESTVKFNAGMYSSFDQYNQNVGLDTPLDFLFTEKTIESRNPIDPNWGGKDFTENALKAGEYEGREVYKYK